MLDRIGMTAGQIYAELEHNGPHTMTALKKKIDNNKDLVPMGIGWLARENKIAFLEEGRNLKITIK